MIERLSIINFFKEMKLFLGFFLIIIFMLLCFFSTSKVSGENKDLTNQVKKQDEINAFKDCPTCPKMVFIKVDHNLKNLIERLIKMIYLRVK